MPAIDVAQIRIEATQLLNFYNEPEAFAKEAREFFQAHSDPLFRRSPTVTVHAPLNSYGAPPMVMRTLIGGLRKVATSYPQYTLPVVQRLWADTVREQRLLAIELLGLIVNSSANEAETLMNRWIIELDDLELAEALAIHVGGAWILGDARVRLDRVREWVNSPQKHQRQFGVMSLLPLAKLRNFGDVALALSTLTGVMREDDTEIRKSVARVIREMSVRGPAETTRFLSTWADTIDKNTDWIIRHSVEKLDVETKEAVIGVLRGKSSK
jgi:hypothetical protein